MTRELILIVEDEPKIASLIQDYLLQDGYRTHVIDDGDQVIDWVRQNSPDLITLDIMLPGKDGLTICREIRSFSDAPIIMVTARVEEVDRLLGLELGADDYVCKPFNAREVVLRVRAILKRIQGIRGSSDHSYRGLTLNPDRYEAVVDSNTLQLTPVEFRLLTLLRADPRRVFSRDQLIDGIYTDGRIVSDRTVDSHVKNLRRKLVEATGQEDWIRSIYGVGYRLD